MDVAQQDGAWATGLSHPPTCNLHGGSLVLAHMCKRGDLGLTLWEAGHIQTLGSYLLLSGPLLFVIHGRVNPGKI